MPERGNQPASITDSPLFWLVRFGVVALVALVIVGPKYAQRQAQLERQRQGREEAWRERLEGAGAQPGKRVAPGDGPAVTPSTNLWPLFLVIAAVVVPAAAWLVLNHIHRTADPDDPL